MDLTILHWTSLDLIKRKALDFSRAFSLVRTLPDYLNGGGGGSRTHVRKSYNLNYYTVSQLLDLTGYLRT